MLFVESRERDFSFSGSFSRWLHMLWLDKAKLRNFIWVPYVRYRPRYFDHPLLLSMHFAVELHQKCSSLDSKQQPYALLGSQVAIRPSVLQHQPSVRSKYTQILFSATRILAFEFLVAVYQIGMIGSKNSVLMVAT